MDSWKTLIPKACILFILLCTSIQAKPVEKMTFKGMVDELEIGHYNWRKYLNIDKWYPSASRNGHEEFSPIIHHLQEVVQDWPAFWDEISIDKYYFIKMAVSNVGYDVFGMHTYAVKVSDPNATVLVATHGNWAFYIHPTCFHAFNRKTDQYYYYKDLWYDEDLFWFLTEFILYDELTDKQIQLYGNLGLNDYE